MSDKEILKARGWQFNEDGLIDRKALLRRLEVFLKWCGDARKSGTEFCIDVIKDMPYAQPEPKWIPNTLNNIPKDPLIKQIQLDNGWIITGWFDEEFWKWYSVPYEPVNFEDVVAWCELREPYQPESEE